MFAIAFDLSIADAQRNFSRGSRQAYLDVEKTLAEFGFERVQWSVFAGRNGDLAHLFSAMDALRTLGSFGKSVKNIRAFRMEQGSDFTAIVKRDT